MPTPDVDVARILSVLDEHEVTYVVIGGFAIELHDVAVPPTRDIDVTPATDPGNLERLADALSDLDARFRVAGGPTEGVAVPGGVSAPFLAEMVSVSFITDAGPLDINLRPDGTEGYGDLVSGRVQLTYQDRLVPTASLEDVIRSKEAAGRPKDIQVIPALRAHLRRGGNGRGGH